jgi:hypothetical protein
MHNNPNDSQINAAAAAPTDVLTLLLTTYSTALPAAEAAACCQMADTRYKNAERDVSPTHMSRVLFRGKAVSDPLSKVNLLQTGKVEKPRKVTMLSVAATMLNSVSIKGWMRKGCNLRQTWKDDLAPEMICAADQVEGVGHNADRSP